MATNSDLRENSISDLLSGLSQESAALIREQLRLVVTDIAAEGRQVGTSVGLLGGAAALGVGAFGALTAALIADPSTAGIEVDLTERALRIQAVDFGRFTELLPKVARAHGIRLLTVSPSDESLESVFSYLVAA